jgi:hypothetical protein
MLKRKSALGLVILLGLLGVGLGVTMAMPGRSVGKVPENSQVQVADQLTDGPSYEEQVDQITETVLSYVEGQRDDDPLVEVRNGVWAKSSNYNGVVIAGQTYYYGIFPHQSFDPFTRGIVAADAVRIVREISNREFTVIIYVIINPGTKA